VIGGGISGLAAAHRLVELNRDVDLSLFEASGRLGGVLTTLHENGFQVEQSADNFITTVPWGLDLCKRLGLGDQLVQTNPTHRRTFVVRRGRLHKLPDGFLMMAPTRLWPMAVTPILSPFGKLRAGFEYFLPACKDNSDESMAAFVRRRLGREVFERLVEPLVSAVYAADMEKLSLLATLPRFREMERKHGSLIRAMRRQKRARGQSQTQSGARYSMFVTLRDGLSSLIDTLAAGLPEHAVHLNAPVERIELDGNRWRLWVSGQEGGSQFDGVILATPAHVAAGLLQSIEAELAASLGSIAHEGTAILSVAYRRDQIAHPLDGMGFVVPAIENSPILAGSFSSQKYVHRAPDGCELLRIFAGGARAPEMAQMDEGELEARLLPELGRLLGIRGDPIYKTSARWPGTMPQYHVGHVDLVERIRSRTVALPNLDIAGNAYEGVGIPTCIHSGEQAAQRLLGQEGEANS
jgi:oxygen-dependent protoporphyrinogen oxidase